MKNFLLEKIQISEQAQQTNLKDIEIWKDMVKLEKNVNSKKQAVILEQEAEIKQLREEAIERHSEHLVAVNDLKSKLHEVEADK